MLTNKGKKIRDIFNEADKAIPNLLTSYNTINFNEIIIFSNLPTPINSFTITSYIENQLIL